MLLGWVGDAGRLVGSTGAPLGTSPGLDVWTLFGTASPIRAVSVVLLVFLIGIGLWWWDDTLMDRSVDAATARPVASLAYGLATHFAIAFAVVLLTAKLGRVTLGGFYFGWLGVLVGVGLLLVTATVGFSVVGIIVLGLLADVDAPGGVLLGAIIAGTVTLLDPLLGVATWLLVVSAGIGGFAREWLTADALPNG